MEAQFFKAREEYTAAIKTHSDALTAALETDALDADAKYERALRSLKESNKPTGKRRMILGQ